MLIAFLKGNKSNIKKNNFLWNTVAGIVNAAEAVLIMMVITRTNGIEAAGTVSIAFALGNLLMTVGKFGVRNFQVTDIEEEYSFAEYKRLRVISSLIMTIIAFTFATLKYLFGDYSYDKAVVILGICLIYVVESYEDVYLGLYQERGRLDIASKIFIMRWMFILFSFVLIAVIKQDMMLSVYISLIGSIIIDVYLIRIANDFLKKNNEICRWHNIGKLVKQCFALFLTSFLVYYVTNAPKYAIDRCLTEDMQAYYGYISMPVFVVELLNCFLYQPQMVELAKEWKQQDWERFDKRVMKQSLYIMGLTILCVAGAYLFGIPILSVLYGVDLFMFKDELILLMMAGGGLAFVGYSGVLLTIMRKQTVFLINILVVSLLFITHLNKTILQYGIYGGVICYLILIFLLAVLNYCGVIIERYK